MWTEHANIDWIHSVCHQFTRVAGWPLTFAPVTSTLEEELAERRTHPEYSWRAEIDDGERPLGHLCLALPSHRPLDDSYLRACESADLIAQLIQRVLIQHSTTGRLRSVSSTSGVDSPKSLSDADAWSQSVDRVLDIGLRLTGFRAAALFVLDPQAESFRLRAERTWDRQTIMMYPRPLNDAPIDLQALRDQSVVIRRTSERFSEWLPDGMQLGVCLGLHAADGIRGTLWFFDRRDRRLTARDELVLQSIAARLGDLIEKAVLIEESALQRQLRAELRIASESQPAESIVFTGVDNWCDIAGHTESASEVGGDLCEVMPLGEDRVLIAIGDAAGHSIPAAMVMSTVRGALRVLVDEASGDIRPAEIVTRINRVLHSVVDSHQFMTFFCSVIDGKTGTMTFANGGHPPPLLIRDGQAEPLETHGLLLGVVGDARYQPCVVNLSEDDLIIFYTDGITEAACKNRNLFQSQGIIDSIEKRVQETPQEIVDHIWAAVDTHLAATSFDDRTLLVMRYAGSAVALPEGESRRLPTAS